MIFTAILDLLYNALYFICGYFLRLADVSMTSAVSTSIATASSYYAALNSYLPLDTAITIVLFDIAFETSFFVYKMIRWGYKKIPMID